MPTTAIAAGAQVHSQVVSNMQGKWIRRTSALTAVVQMLRETPPPNSTDLAARIRDAIQLAGKDDCDLEDVRERIRAALTSLGGLRDVLQETEQQLSEAETADSRAAAEVILNRSLERVHDPVLQQAEAALMRHLEKLHDSDDD